MVTKKFKFRQVRLTFNLENEYLAFFLQDKINIMTIVGGTFAFQYYISGFN